MDHFAIRLDEIISQMREMELTPTELEALWEKHSRLNTDADLLIQTAAALLLREIFWADDLLK